MSSKVYLVTTQLLKPDGSGLSTGGIARYCQDLCDVLVSMGQECIVIQMGRDPFERELSPHVKVIGVRGSLRMLRQLWFGIRLPKMIEPGCPVIYVAMQIAWPVMVHPCMSIQHGIWWDSDEMSTWEVRLQTWAIRKIVSRSDEMICVDANFINWFRATWPHRPIARKLRYIPNYVDPEEFYRKPLPSGREEIVVVYPRLLVRRRGMMMLAEVIGPVLEECPNVRFHFIGDGPLEGELREYIKERGFEDVTKIYVLSRDDMQQAYEQADIVVIPTVAGEGTSLSCVEAMYCGRPVISTIVGGLSNLVLDGYNGLLISPVAEELRDAIIRLAKNPALRKELGDNAHETAKKLTIDVWRERVKRKLERLLALRKC